MFLNFLIPVIECNMHIDIVCMIIVPNNTMKRFTFIIFYNFLSWSFKKKKKNNI